MKKTPKTPKNAKKSIVGNTRTEGLALPRIDYDNITVEYINDKRVKVLKDEKTPKTPETLKFRKRKSWFFTFNNYCDNDIQILINKFNEICESYIFQEEMGIGDFTEINDNNNVIKVISSEGTKHLQGVIFLKEDMSYQNFLLNNTIHWEGTRNKKFAIDYCRKSQTCNGKKWSKNIETNKKNKLNLEFEFNIESLYPWQKSVLNIVNGKPDKRKIIFIQGDGNNGKTQFTKWLCVNYDILSIYDKIKSSDIFDSLSNKLCDEENGKKIQNNNILKTVVLDCPRSCEINRLDFGMIEAIKNGAVMASKYKTCNLLFDTPHIIIFSNHLPSIHLLKNNKALTLDRWAFFIIKNNELLELPIKINVDVETKEYDINHYVE